jgi:group I intron endonuclease
MRIKLSGIYCFINKTTGKRYVGQTAYLAGRKGHHLLHLRRNNHDNSYFQNAFNKYGESDFVFEVLEVVPKLEDGTNDKVKLTEREQYWMDFYKSYEEDFGYNINPSASMNYMSGRTHTEEARKKISDAAKGRVLSEELKKKMCDARRNTPSTSRDKQVKKEAKHEVSKPGKTYFEYHVTTPEGIEHVFTNLTEFCALNNLSRTHLASMLNKDTFYKGWTGYKVHVNDTKEMVEIIVSEEAKHSANKGKVFEYHLFDRIIMNMYLETLRCFVKIIK